MVSMLRSTMRNSAWRTRLAVTVALLAVAGGAVTACGGAKSGNGATPASASADPVEQGRKFARCMREHGIDLPDPGQEGVLLSPSAGQRLDPNTPAIKAAREACKAVDPNVGGEAPPPIDQTQLTQMRDYAKCMREHGVNMPDPDPEANGGGGQVLNTNPNDPVFKAAAEACKDKVPNGVATTMGPGK